MSTHSPLKFPEYGLLLIIKKHILKVKEEIDNLIISRILCILF